MAKYDNPCYTGCKIYIILEFSMFYFAEQVDTCCLILLDD